MPRNLKQRGLRYVLFYRTIDSQMGSYWVPVAICARPEMAILNSHIPGGPVRGHAAGPAKPFYQWRRLG